MNSILIRPAGEDDTSNLRHAIVELQDYERRLHDTRLPGEAIANAYLAHLEESAADGAILVAEFNGTFAGFVAGWIEEDSSVAETPDSNRFGYVSDICVLPAFRGRRIASLLLDELERRFREAGVVRMRVSVLAANASARASYEAAGFAEYEVVYEKRVAMRDT
jgi:ribosomal protein S18 acetylase RimI-like enzyme